MSVEAFVHAATLRCLLGCFPHSCPCHRGCDGSSVLELPRDNAHTQEHSVSGCPWGLCAPLLHARQAGIAHWQEQGSDFARRKAMEKAELCQLHPVQGQLKHTASVLLLPSFHQEGERVQISAQGSSEASSQPLGHALSLGSE